MAALPTKFFQTTPSTPEQIDSKMDILNALQGMQEYLKCMMLATSIKASPQKEKETPHYFTFLNNNKLKSKTFDSDTNDWSPKTADTSSPISPQRSKHYSPMQKSKQIFSRWQKKQALRKSLSAAHGQKSSNAHPSIIRKSIQK